MKVPWCPLSTLSSGLPQCLQPTGPSTWIALSCASPPHTHIRLLPSLCSDIHTSDRPLAPPPIPHGTFPALFPFKLSSHHTGGRKQRFQGSRDQMDEQNLEGPHILHICNSSWAHSQEASRTAPTCFARICNYHVDGFAPIIPFAVEGKGLKGRTQFILLIALFSVVLCT